jgi:hypothetical protein
MGKVVCIATMEFTVLQLDKIISIIFKKQQRYRLQKAIQTPPSYDKRQRDGITLPQKDTYLNAYKILSLSTLPSKTKELLSRSSMEQSGCTIRHSNQAWYQTPHA